MIAIIIVVQALIVQFAGEFVGTHSLTSAQWLLCIVAVLLLIPFMLLSRLMIKIFRSRSAKKNQVKPGKSSRADLPLAVQSSLPI
jgi:hypothetical protein